MRPMVTAADVTPAPKLHRVGYGNGIRRPQCEEEDETEFWWGSESSVATLGIRFVYLYGEGKRSGFLHSFLYRIMRRDNHYNSMVQGLWWCAVGKKINVG